MERNVGTYAEYIWILIENAEMICNAEEYTVAEGGNVMTTNLHARKHEIETRRTCRPLAT